MFERRVMAGWGDMDVNGHMRNTAYLDKAADVRMLFFAEHGFPISEFMRLRLGPVAMMDEIEYRREVNLLDELTVTLALAGSSTDGSRFMIRNELFCPDGELAARVTTTGGWLDLIARKLIVPPPGLLAATHTLVRTTDFRELPSSIKQD